MMADIALYHDDCFKVFDRIPEKSVHMILCDMPYGTTRNKIDERLPLPDLWSQYRRIIKDNGSILLFADGFFLAELMASNRSWWRYNIVWDKVLKTGFLNAKRMPLREHEEICVFYKKQPTYNPQFTEGRPQHGKGTSYLRKCVVNNNYGKYAAVEDDRKGNTKKYPTSILTFSKPHASIAKHPTEKPVELLRYLIRTYTNEGDTVLDNCMGAGSTGIAALREGRKFIGIEKNDGYFKIARDRILGSYRIPNDEKEACNEQDL